MKHLMSKKLFKTNTHAGIVNYLAGKGFDPNRAITWVDGPPHFVFAVQEEVAVVKKEDRKEVIKKRAKVVKKTFRKVKK